MRLFIHHYQLAIHHSPLESSFPPLSLSASHVYIDLTRARVIPSTARYLSSLSFQPQHGAARRAAPHINFTKHNAQIDHVRIGEATVDPAFMTTRVLLSSFDPAVAAQDKAFENSLANPLRSYPDIINLKKKPARRRRGRGTVLWLHFCFLRAC